MLGNQPLIHTAISMFALYIIAALDYASIIRGLRSQTLHIHI